jgi:hypothetical protein
LFERPQNKRKPEEIRNERKFPKENGTSRGNSKGSSPSTTPFGRRNFVRIVELTIPEAPNLSILKRGG